MLYLCGGDPVASISKSQGGAALGREAVGEELRMVDVDRDGVPLRGAELPNLLSAVSQVSIVLSETLAASWLKYIPDTRRRASICRMTRNPDLGDVPVEVNPIVALIRGHERCANATRQQGLQKRLFQGTLAAFGETTGNPLDGLRPIPRTALRSDGHGGPEFNFHLGYIRHRAWKPEVVHSVVLVDPTRAEPPLAVDRRGTREVHSRFAAIDSKALRRMNELHAAGGFSARANAETVFDGFIREGLKPAELGASRQAATDRWRKGFETPTHPKAPERQKSP